MELARIDSKYYCGVDLHVRSMFICIMDKSGNILLHRNMQNNFDIFKTYVGDYIPGLAIGVENSYGYYWLADAFRRAGIPFYLGHAYYMIRIHGGKKKNGRLDSKTIVVSALVIFIGAQPRTGWLGNIVACDEHGFILSGPDISPHSKIHTDPSQDRLPFLLGTSLPGVFVAGDARHGSVKRVASAVGEVSMAVMYIHRYLSSV